jgi:hypothetical protein
MRKTFKNSSMKRPTPIGLILGLYGIDRPPLPASPKTHLLRPTPIGPVIKLFG